MAFVDVGLGMSKASDLALHTQPMSKVSSFGILDPLLSRLTK